MGKGVLLLTPFFSPNIGGVETHFDDLVKALSDRKYDVFVQTYSPITTPNVKWKSYEEKGKRIKIWRYRWFGKGLFNKIEKYHFLDFLYLTPYLFLRTFLWMMKNHEKIDVIHAQGFNAALIGVYLKKIFKKKLIVSVQAVYQIQKDSKTAKRIAHILKQADKVTCQCEPSKKEIASFGIPEKNIALFKHWIDINRFKKMSKETMRKKLGLENKFTVLFIGRLIEKKGARVLVEVAKQLKDIKFVFVGLGPDEEFLRNQAKNHSNIRFLGSVPYERLHEYYNIADIFCIPSQYEEGWGRVAIEAVACEVPVVGSNKGGIPEAINSSVAILVDPTIENLKKSIKKLYEDKKLYNKLRGNCRKYAEKNCSEKNINNIIKFY